MRAEEIINKLTLFISKQFFTLAFKVARKIKLVLESREHDWQRGALR